MPNHVTNRLQIFGSEKQIKEIHDKYSTFYPEIPATSLGGEIVYKNKEGDYGWLNKETNQFQIGSGNEKHFVEGVPDGYEVLMEDAFTRFPDFNKVIPMPKVVEASIETGGSRPLWYDWSVENWGSKWNAYDNRKDEDVFVFDTAWSPVPQIIEEISLNFPDVEITYEWADEDTGSNVGTILFKNGSIDINQPENQSREAYDLCFKIHPEDKQYYKLVDGNYTYDEDTEYE